MKSKIYQLFSVAIPVFFALLIAVFSGAAYAQTTYTFNYTGSVQTISLPAGNYSIECWGADGGSATNGTTLLAGGKGGYSSGVYTNTSTAVHNIYVGGRGGNASGASQVGSGGGGMSDVAPASNTNIVIIAAGGGGGSTSGGTTNENSTGGDGGGLTGGTAIDGTGVTGGSAATGGSQSAGGSATAGIYGVGSPGGFGYGGGAANGGTLGVMHSAGGGGGNGGTGGWNGGGGGCTLTGINDHSAGGGAGYYGGGGGRGDGGAGGGGSSYIGGVSSGTTIMSGQTGFVTNPDVAGNGHVLITELCSISLVASGSNSLNPTICSGQSLTLTTNAISNYSWSTGATTSSLVVSPTSNTVYALTAMSPSNCTASRNISITVSSGPPVLSISNPSSNICLGKAITLTASGALTYTWNPGVVNGQTFTPSSTAVYTVTGQNGCGISTATTAVTVAPLTVTAIANPTLICAGSPSTLTAVSSVTSYTWYPNAVPANSLVVGPVANTVYTVAASDGTCSGTQTVLVSTKVTPTVLVGSTSTICVGQQLVITATGASSYTWMPGNLSGNSVTVSPVTSTVYVVTGENSVNCTNSNQQIVFVETPPSINITAPNLVVCSGQSVMLTANGGNGYAWSGGPNTATYVVTPAATSVYTVTGSHNTNTCTAVKEITISAVVPNLTLPSNTAICAGGTASLTAGGADLYTWNSISTGSTGIFNMTPQATATVTLVATTQSLSISCPTTHTFVVTVNPLPTLTVTPTKTVICKGETNTLTVSGAQTYSWTSTITGNTMVITPTANMIFTVAGKDANGCVNVGTHQAKVNNCNGISEIGTSPYQLNIYPNPNSGNFHVTSDNDVTLIIINQLGQEIRLIELTRTNGLTAEVKGLAPGIYFISDQKKAAPALRIVVN